MVIADGGWRTGGVAAEVSATGSENGFQYLKAPIKRVTLPDTPAPASSVLEKEYYKNYEDIIHAAKEVMKER